MRTAELFKPSPQPPPNLPDNPRTNPREGVGGRRIQETGGGEELPLPKRRRPQREVKVITSHNRARRPRRTGTPKITQCCGTAGRPRGASRPKREAIRPIVRVFCAVVLPKNSNDPSAGSPTETLLRLLLPLNDQVRASSRPTAPPGEGRAETNPRPSLNRSIGSSDGRCVQRAGT